MEEEVMASTAKQVRLARLHRGGAPGLVVVAMDHAVGNGPIVRDRDFDDLVGEIVAGGADAVLLHKGSVARLAPHRLVSARLIVQLNAGTALAPDADARRLVASVEEALRVGADGVSVQVNLGARNEQRQLADLGRVAARCERWQLPLLAMVYPRGPKVTNPNAPDLVAHAVAVAVELGADLVKVPYPESVQALAEITRMCPIPVLVAGGPRLGTMSDLLDFVGDVMRGGAGGVAIGRNVFEAEQPGAITRKIVDLVHGLEARA
jgi:2-amino-4,5-dihydroxy-6-oxo-7-(phosphonooxy)heptanoate synthase